MKSCEGGSAGSPGEEADGEVERAPPGVDRRRAAAVGRAERGEHERRPGGRGEVARRPAPGRRWRARRPRRAAPSRRPPAASGRSRTAPASSRTAASSSRVTSPTARSGQRDARGAPVAVLDDAPRARAGRAIAANAPEPSGAGSGSVSQPRAVRRSAACWSWGSGGASATASLPSTCVCACSVSQVSRHSSRGSVGQAGAMGQPRAVF